VVACAARKPASATGGRAARQAVRTSFQPPLARRRGRESRGGYCDAVSPIAADVSPVARPPAVRGVGAAMAGLADARLPAGRRNCGGKGGCVSRPCPPPPPCLCATVVGSGAAPLQTPRAAFGPSLHYILSKQPIKEDAERNEQPRAYSCGKKS